MSIRRNSFATRKILVKEPYDKWFEIIKYYCFKTKIKLAQWAKDGCHIVVQGGDERNDRFSDGARAQIHSPHMDVLVLDEDEY